MSEVNETNETSLKIEDTAAVVFWHNSNVYRVTLVKQSKPNILEATQDCFWSIVADGEKEGSNAIVQGVPQVMVADILIKFFIECLGHVVIKDNDAGRVIRMLDGKNKVFLKGVASKIVSNFPDLRDMINEMSIVTNESPEEEMEKVISLYQLVSTRSCGVLSFIAGRMFQGNSCSIQPIASSTETGECVIIDVVDDEEVK